MGEQYFVKLYKDLDIGKEYWEAWLNTAGNYTEHYGLLGTKGESSVIKDTLLRKGINKIRNIEKKKKKSGYRQLVQSELYKVVLQYKIEGNGNNKDLNKAKKIQGLMNEELGWTGLGYCDGYDIGSGTINIYSFVVNVELFTDIIIKFLKAKRVYQGVVVMLDDELGLSLLYPKDYKGELKYM